MSNIFRGFSAILFKEFIVVFRDRAALFFMFFPPLVQIVAFGFALDNDVKHMAMVVFDEDRTRESRQMVDRFVNTETFRVVQYVGSAEEMSGVIRRGKAYVGLQIPPTFTRDLRAGRGASLQLLVDGSNSTTALQGLNTAMGITLTRSTEIMLAETGRKSLPVEIRPQMLYNPSMRSPNFFVPGVIGLALQIATVFSTTLSIVRERERGTLEQLLVSPVTAWGLMLGKLVPYFCISGTMAAGLLVVMRWVFLVPISGSILALLLSALLFVFTLLCLGLVISTKAETTMQAFQMTMVLILPSVFFSGFIFPRETMPWIFRAIGSLLPATYFIELMRGIVLRGAHFADYWTSLAVLAGMSVVLFTLCAVRFQKKTA
jgi:ABC-2 type transport system permease protein